MINVELFFYKQALYFLRHCNNSFRKHLEITQNCLKMSFSHSFTSFIKRSSNFVIFYYTLAIK